MFTGCLWLLSPVSGCSQFPSRDASVQQSLKSFKGAGSAPGEVYAWPGHSPRTAELQKHPVWRWCAAGTGETQYLLWWQGETGDWA